MAMLMETIKTITTATRGAGKTLLEKLNEKICFLHSLYVNHESKELFCSDRCCEGMHTGCYDSHGTSNLCEKNLVM
jgi:hypothetical protein